MADYLIDKKVTQDQADRLQAPMETDLTALFKVMESELIKKTEQFDGTPEGLILELIRPLNNLTGGLWNG